MIAPKIPSDEEQRLAALDKLGLLYTDFENRFDRITSLASRIFGVPMAFISFVAEDKQWFKSCFGMGTTRETGRGVSFCGHAILEEKTMIVEDARKDERFIDNPLVVNPPHIVFYAGRPLHFDGQRVGTLCIADTKPRTLSMEEVANLNDLAIWVEREMGNFDRDLKNIGSKIEQKKK